MREEHILRRGTEQNGFSLVFFRYARPLGKWAPSVKKNRFSSMKPRNEQFWQITMFPMPSRVIGKLTVTDLLLTDLQSLDTDKKKFPDVSGFSVVEGWVPHRTEAKDSQNYVYHAALKIHGQTKRRPLRDTIRSFVDSFVQTEAFVDSFVQTEVRGLAGWDRLCKRIFAEAPEHYFRRYNFRRYNKDPKKEMEDFEEIDFLAPGGTSGFAPFESIL